MTPALVIGGGPAGLMAADVMSAAGVPVILADQMPTIGRKFLMAGKSGLNLTKDEPLKDFTARYLMAAPTFLHAVTDFGPSDIVDWAESLDQETFVGSSRRVFPKAMKASPLLRAWRARLIEQGVDIRTRWRWTGWSQQGAMFSTPDGAQVLQAQATILALGGASWRKLGSDGKWVDHIEKTAPFEPSNGGFEVSWSRYMQPFFGQPVKAVILNAGATSSRGEFVITPSGLEGGGIYEVSAALRHGTSLTLDLVPDISADIVQSRIVDKRSKQSWSEFLRKTMKLPAIKAALFQEFAKGHAKRPVDEVAKLFKALPFPQLSPLPMDQAISTVGGVRFEDLNEDLMLINKPGVFCAGEMLNWDAPTGGYLLTACLATGRKTGQSALAWIGALESSQKGTITAR